MTAIHVLLTIYTALAILYWLRMAYAAVRMRRGVPRLTDTPPPEVWPPLSVIVPACNEAETIEAAARTLMAQDYPNLEILLVDDRSTDSTGAIIDRLAASDERVKAVHLTGLPEGWLGKVNAMNRGAQQARGDYLLLTDADVHFEPATLRRAVAWAEARGLDHLVALPSLWPAGLLVNATIASFIRQFLAAVRPWAVRSPESRAFMGVGAFNLVRRRAFEAAGGFEWLRMEVADDMGLGMMMKRSGARCGVVAAFGQVGLHWYRTLADATRGAEKAFASASGCRLWRIAVAAAIMLAMETAPLAALVPLFFGPTRVIGCGGVVVFGLFVASTVLLTRWAGAGMLPGLLGPLVALPNAWAFLRAGLLGWYRGGVVWRGTLYPADVLRRGCRVRFP
ncbi:MAG TPA: glycosyltransferase family 2 protein [Phycisphaerae bacterium]|nr:glycosyltransferase family 2 protein [Phycisphaerae bacterium]